MAISGFRVFQSDTAFDFAQAINHAVDGEVLELLSSAVGRVAQWGDSYLDSDLGIEAWIAAELLKPQAILEAPEPAFGAAAHKVRRSCPSEELVSLALQALERIKGPESELNELLSEAGLHDDWLTEISELEYRLRGG